MDGAPEAAGAVRFVFRPPLDLLNRAHVAWIIDTCRREGITVVVLDTWTTLSPSANPLGTMDQAQLAAVVVDLAEQIDGQVIVVDHSRKNRPDGKPLSSADIFGPPQKWAAAEHVIMLARSDGRPAPGSLPGIQGHGRRPVPARRRPSRGRT